MAKPKERKLKKRNEDGEVKKEDEEKEKMRIRKLIEHEKQPMRIWR